MKYIVHYGAPFSIYAKEFNTEKDARAFINAHVFDDPRYCYVEKIEEVHWDFNFVDRNDTNCNAVSDKLFHHGIVTKHEWEISKNYG